MLKLSDLAKLVAEDVPFYSYERVLTSLRSAAGRKDVPPAKRGHGKTSCHLYNNDSAYRGKLFMRIMCSQMLQPDIRSLVIEKIMSGGAPNSKFCVVDMCKIQGNPIWQATLTDDPAAVEKLRSSAIRLVLYLPE